MLRIEHHKKTGGRIINDQQLMQALTDCERLYCHWIFGICLQKKGNAKLDVFLPK